jgi:hypothetical protein
MAQHHNNLGHASGPPTSAHLSTIACCATQLQPSEDSGIKLCLCLHGHQHGMLAWSQPQVDALGPCCCCSRRCCAAVEVVWLVLAVLAPVAMCSGSSKCGSVSCISGVM